MSFQNNLNKIKAVFDRLDIDWVEPYWTTEGAINRKEAGYHTGLYYIYPEVNFYFGKAGKGGTIYGRHKTHRPKLDVDLRTLYGVERIKSQPQWIFPAGWKEAVRKYIIEDCGDIPEHAVRVGPKQYGPGVLDFPVTHKIDIDTLPVLLWNLDHLDYKDISLIEEIVIETIWPYANDETYQRRKKGFPNG